MIIVKDQKELGGYDSQGNRYIWVDLECDSISDLPQPDYFKTDAACIISMGSKAHTIQENADFMMQSSGSWSMQQPGSAAYTKSEVDALIAAAVAQIIPLAYGLGVQIPNGADFDAYTTPGVFYVGSNAAAATMSNIPAAYGGRLEIKATISSTYFIQEYTTNSTPVNKYIRRKLASGYTAWQSVNYT